MTLPTGEVIDRITQGQELYEASGKIVSKIIDVISIGALPALIVFLILKIIFNWINKHK